MNKENHPTTGLFVLIHFVSVQSVSPLNGFICAVKASPSRLLLWGLLLPDCLRLGYFVNHAGSRGKRRRQGWFSKNVSRVMRVRWSYHTRTKKRITRCSFALFFPLTRLLLTTCTGSSLSSKRSWGPMFRATHTEAKDGHEHPQQTRRIMTDIQRWRDERFITRSITPHCDHNGCCCNSNEKLLFQFFMRPAVSALIVFSFPWEFFQYSCIP